MDTTVRTGSESARDASVAISATAATARTAEIDLDLEEAYEHRAELTEICRRIVGDAALAEDVVQETYLQAVKNIHRLERRDGLMPWLVTVATRRSLNELRRRKYSTTVETMPDRETAPEHDPCVAVTLSDEFDRVSSIMSTLTARERDLLMRQVYDGVTLAELAEMEHTSAASVRSVLSRARAKIKTAIAQSGARIILPVTIFFERQRRRIEPLAMRVDRFEMATKAAMSPGEVIGAGVLSLSLALSGPLGALADFGGGSSDRDSSSPATDVTDGEGAGGTGVLGRPGSGTASTGDGTTPTSAARARAAETAGEPGSATDEGGGGADPLATPFAPPSPESVPDPGGAPEPPPVEPDGPGEQAQEPDETYAEDWEESDDGTLFYLGTTQAPDCSVGCSNLFVSQDGGATWERMGGNGLEATELLLPPDPADDRIFAVGSTGLLVSFDGGEHFEPVLMAPASSAAISPRFSRGEPRILVGSQPAWEWNGTSGQARPMTALGASAQHTHFGFAPASPDDATRAPLLFAGVADVEGQNVVAAVRTCTLTTADDVCNGRVVLPALTDVPRVSVSSTFPDDQIVIAWGREGAFRSTDAGGSFEPIDIPLGSVDQVVDNGDGTFYAAGYTFDGNFTTGGIAVSRSRGRTWRLLGAGEGDPLAAGTRSVSVLRDGTIMTGATPTGGGGIYCSHNGGRTWSSRCDARVADGPSGTTTTIATD